VKVGSSATGPGVPHLVNRRLVAAAIKPDRIGVSGGDPDRVAVQRAARDGIVRGPLRPRDSVGLPMATEQQGPSVRLGFPTLNFDQPRAHGTIPRL